MTMSEFTSLGDAKAHLSELVSRVGAQHDRVTLTVHGRPTAVLLSVEDLETLEETVAVLSDAAAMRALAAADVEIARGEGGGQADLDAAMRRRPPTG
jgi:prevent-host-death family protein